jgi:hypothetical protein
VLPRNLGEHHAIASRLAGFKSRSDPVPPLSKMSGTNDPDAHQARAHRVRVARVSGRQLRSRRPGRNRDPFDEVDILRAAGAGLGRRHAPRPQGSLSSSRKIAGLSPARTFERLGALRWLTPGRPRTRSFGHERYSSSPSKKVRAAVGRPICLAGRAGHAENHRLERWRQQLAAPRKGKTKTRRAEQAGLAGTGGTASARSNSLMTNYFISALEPL